MIIHRADIRPVFCHAGLLNHWLSRTVFFYTRFIDKQHYDMII